MMNKTMPAVVCRGKGDIRLDERPVPGDAIVKVEASSICASGLHLLGGAVPNALASAMALCEETQALPLHAMYGKNLVFKTGGVDAGPLRRPDPLDRGGQA